MNDLITRNRKSILTIAAALFAVALAFSPIGAGANAADQGKEAPVTPATAIHGTPGNTAGFSDQVKGAAPAGTADGADGGIHNIASVPGQSGVSPQDRDTPPACTAHGGLNTKNPNC